MADQIRVLRILEYVYADADVMTQDMARWTRHMHQGRRGMSMRSVNLDARGVLVPAMPAVTSLSDAELEHLLRAVVQERDLRLDSQRDDTGEAVLGHRHETDDDRRKRLGL